MKIVSALLIVLILMPIFLYIYQFGFGFWADHAKWAEMGSFFGGILGPAITVISVGFLYVQLKAHQKQQQYTLDALKLQKIESDIVFFIATVKTELAREIPTMNNKVLNEILGHHAAEFCSVHTNYQGEENPDFIIDGYRRRSFDFLICYEGLFSSWIALNAHLHKLNDLDITLKMDSYKSQKARIFTSLDSYICSHLDTISMLLDTKYVPHFRPSFKVARDKAQAQFN